MKIQFAVQRNILYKYLPERLLKSLMLYNNKKKILKNLFKSFAYRFFFLNHFLNCRN